MKKIMRFLMIVGLLVLPFCANASYLGYGDLNVTASTPTGSGYYLDYDGVVVSSNFGFTSSSKEVFCVSPEDGNGGLYDFYTITPDLTNFTKLSQAAWIADNWMNYTTTADLDTRKGEAQKAVWKIMGVMDIVGSDGTDLNIYNDAIHVNGYITKNWIYALSPSQQAPNATNYQDFLVQYNAVPEPASLLLLGLGLLGIAGIRRKK